MNWRLRNSQHNIDLTIIANRMPYPAEVLLLSGMRDEQTFEATVVVRGCTTGVVLPRINGVTPEVPKVTDVWVEVLEGVRPLKAWLAGESA